MTVLPGVGLTILASYLVGATPFGYLIARWRGLDIRRQGSGNIGATNVARVLGRKFGLLVFALDFAKGALPVAAAGWVERQLGPGVRLSLGADGLRVAAGMAAFLGHLFPVYLQFKGGKGVATGAGAVAVLLPGPALAAALAWLTVTATTRYVSLASMAAAAVLCGTYLATTPRPFGGDHYTLTSFCLLAAGLVAARHRANVGRLLRGTENRLPNSPTMRTVSKVIHVLTLGTWFGSALFFTFVVGFSMFANYRDLGSRLDHRPGWFPLPPAYASADETLDGPREQGTRAAGFGVAPLFKWYFFLQGICGLLATATALNWSQTFPGPRIHRVRTWVLLVALATVLIGWPLERKVSALGQERDAAADKYLQSPAASRDAARADLLAAKRPFDAWHGASMSLNLLTLILAGVALALAAKLPEESLMYGRADAAPAGEGGLGERAQTRN